MPPIYGGVRRLFGFFIAALLMLGVVLLALPHFTLAEFEDSLRSDYADDVLSLDYRIDHGEPLERIFMEYPPFVGYRTGAADATGNFRYAQSRRPPAVGRPGQLLYQERPPLLVLGGAGSNSRLYYFDGRAIAGIATARRMLLIYGIAGLIALAISLFTFVRRVTAPYHEITDALAGADVLQRNQAVSDVQISAALKHVIAQLRSREAELEKLGRQQRERAEQSEAVFATLLSGADFPIALYLRGGRLAQTNAAVRALLAGRDRLPPELSGRLDAALTAGTPLLDEHWQPDPALPPMTLSLLPVVAASDQRERGLLLFDREAAAARLRRQLDEKAHLTRVGELSGVIAHETRNALGTIRGRVQLLGRAAQPGTEPHIQAIIEEVDGLEKMVQSVLTLARPEEARAVSLAAAGVLGAAAERFALVPGMPPLSTSVSDGCSPLRADPQLLGQMLDNLLRNAAAAAPSGPLELRVREAPEGVEITVADGGPGFPAATLSGGAAGGAAGGFGLPLCRKWAGLMGGELRLSNAPSGGAEATLILPRATPAVRESAG
jgi:signal transduction histidine kinase